MEDPRWRAGQARRAALWVWPRIPPYLVLLRVGFTLPPNVAAGAVRSYRTFSPLPCALRRRRYLLCGTSRLEALKLRSRTLSGTLPCGVRTFLSRSCDRQRPPSCSLVYMVSQAPYLRLSFDLSSINFLVRRTRPKSCVHSETMLPTTCPHFPSESIFA
jgi:hypothetical protein